MMEGDSSNLQTLAQDSEKESAQGSVQDDPTRTGKQGSRTQSIVRVALIAALHGAATLLVLQLMTALAWGPVQFRISEALTVLPLFFAEAVPGLTLGTFIANSVNLGQTGALGVLDVVFGTIATFLGALWTYRLRRRNILLALAGPVVVNAVIVPAYLPIIMGSLGINEVFYALPWLGLSFAGSFALMYLFGLVAVGFGQAVVIYALGLPLARLISRFDNVQQEQLRR